ncbi:MAG: site-specific integrase [Halobacteria archaeon]|nr:site-specific integrase [Halobacteria archaeon]
MSELQPLEPEEGVEMYLDTREDELSRETLRKQKTRLDAFLSWCEDRGIKNLNELTGRDLQRYRQWCKKGKGDGYGKVKNVTLRSNLTTLRVFLEYCANIDGVEKGMRERVMIPEVEDGTKDSKIAEERVRDILDKLETYEYASRRHVMISLMWHGALRIGTIRALDVGDFDPDEPCLKIRHRPSTDTPLKNRESAERDLALGDFYAQVIEDYIEENRHDVQDDYGRHPLITSTEGRLTKTPYRTAAYRVSLPCWTDDCPHGKERKTCEWTSRDKLSHCPSSRSPHDVRRSSITYHLKENVPPEIVSDRVDATPDVIEKHYDKRNEREKMRTRKELLNL